MSSFDAGTHCNNWNIFFVLQIFASDEFLELTEYSREEILGRNCRFVPITK